MLELEKNALSQGYRYCLGVDEAGRGPLAGPVVASAVILKSHVFNETIKDSKQLTPLKREKAFHEIMNKAYVGIGMMGENVIDRHNILQATFFAMNNAVNDCIAKLPNDVSQSEKFKDKLILLIDGNRFETDLPFFYKTIIKGDSKSLSIACASIIAKVTRDRILKLYHQIYPKYGFIEHKGYPTLKHRQAIRKYGLSEFHRKTFQVNV